MTPNNPIPAISRLVAIGRRMKISEMFTKNLARLKPSPSSALVARSLHASVHAFASALLPPSLPSVPAAPPTSAPSAAASSSAAGKIGGDPRATLEPQLSFGDHRFTGPQPFLHHDIVGDPLTRSDRALLDRRIVLDHEDI